MMSIDRRYYIVRLAAAARWVKDRGVRSAIFTKSPDYYTREEDPGIDELRRRLGKIISPGPCLSYMYICTNRKCTVRTVSNLFYEVVTVEWCAGAKCSIFIIFINKLQSLSNNFIKVEREMTYVQPTS
jgi:hypothetical protein